jgi:hypothetical protein
VPYVGLGHQRHHRSAGVAEREHLRILVSLDAGTTGGSERDQLSVFERQLVLRPGEELGVLGHRPWPSALDEPHPHLVEESRHDKLVGDRVGDALALSAITQGGVEDVEAVVHRSLPGVSDQQKDPPQTR